MILFLEFHYLKKDGHGPYKNSGEQSSAILALLFIISWQWFIVAFQYDNILLCFTDILIVFFGLLFHRNIFLHFYSGIFVVTYRHISWVVFLLCGERDIIVTISLWCKCISLILCVYVCACLSEFVWTRPSTFMDSFNPFQNKSWFSYVCCTGLWKTPREEEKLLITSNFSFSHIVLYPFREPAILSIKFEIVVC